MAKYCVVGYFDDRKYKVVGRSEYEAMDNLQGMTEYIGSNEDNWKILSYVNEEDMPADGVIDEDDDKPKVYEFDCVRWPNGCLVTATNCDEAREMAQAIFEDREGILPDEMEAFLVSANDKRFDGVALGYHEYFKEKCGLYDEF